MAFDIDAFFEDYDKRTRIDSNSFALEASLTAEIEKQNRELKRQNKELTEQKKLEIEKTFRARQAYTLATMSLTEQEKATKLNIEFLNKKDEELRLRRKMLELGQREAKSDGQRQIFAEKIAVIEAEQFRNQKLIEGYKLREVKLQEHIAKGATEGATAAERAANAQKRASEFVKKQEENQKLHQKILKENYAIIEDTASTEEERAAARERIAREHDDDIQRNAEALAQSGFSSAAAAINIDRQAKQREEQLTVLNDISSVVSKINNRISNAFTAAANFQSEYMGKVDARLQSEEEQTGFFKQITDDVQDQIGASRFVSQKEVLQNVKVVLQGAGNITFSIEGR